MKKISVGIVGVTGLVGATFLHLLEQSDLDIKELRIFASKRSLGKMKRFRDKRIPIQLLSPHCFDQLDYVFFSAGADIAKSWAPEAVASGAIVIDNSSYWRLYDEYSLIVPEINFPDYNQSASKIIANPNCCVIQASIPLALLQMKFGLKRVDFVTLQAVSGSGRKGVRDFQRCQKGEKPAFFEHNICQTCLPKIDDFMANGYTKEEMKLVEETKKILHLPTLEVNATCIRVPIGYGHGIVLTVELEKCFTLAEVISLFQGNESLVYLDEKLNQYPISTQAVGNNLIYVGRLRQDLFSSKKLTFYCVSDNIRRGASFNAFAILEKLIGK